jgi:hypothetical protein
VSPVLKAVKKCVLSEKTKHIKEAKIRASKMRFVMKIYRIKKIAGITEKRPIFTLPSVIPLCGMNKVIIQVNATTKKTVIKKLKIFVKDSVFIPKKLSFFSNYVSRQINCLKLRQLRVSPFCATCNKKILFIVCKNFRSCSPVFYIYRRKFG